MTERPTWDATWMQVAETIGLRSRCSRAKIGAVIVDTQKRVAATGYNGPAASLMLNGECINWCERAQGKTELTSAYEGCPSIHAEANALLYVDRSAVEGGTIYVTSAPCMQCAKLISNSGLKRVVAIVRDEDAHRKPEVVLDYLVRCNITVETIKDKNDRPRKYQTGTSR
jgi:dCMP deaminase